MASRTHKSILNAAVSLFYYFNQLILGFWSRKVFYDYLGSEVLGLDTTAYSLLNFLNLAELGIGMSVSYFLYQPLADKNTKKITEIVALQGWIYRRIAFIIIFASGVLMCFFPWIFEKSPLPLWYAYATFSVLLFGALLGYFINYREILLTADQKNYKVTVATQGAGVFFKILLILLLPVVSHPFLFYLSTTLAGYVFGCLWLNHIINKEYPWLKAAEADGKELMKKYPDILKKTKQVFIHRISGFITIHLSPIIMYAFASLTIVAYYGNYLVITEKLSSMLNTVFSSTGAGVGNLVANKDSQRIQNVFWELFDSRLCLSWVGLFCVYFLAEPFITIWLGSEYLLSNKLLILIVYSCSIFINRTTVDSFISGYGLFKDVWAPICQMIVTLTSSLVLGGIYGIEGVLTGTVLGQTIFIGLWKPYFLFSQGFNISPFQYFRRFAFRIFLLAISFTLLYGCVHILDLKSINSYVSFFIYALIVFVEVCVIVVSLFFLFTAGTRDFFYRMKSLILCKISK